MQHSIFNPLTFIQIQKWNFQLCPDLTACGTSPSQGEV